jgi:hypothetical protein
MYLIGLTDGQPAAPTYAYDVPKPDPVSRSVLRNRHRRMDARRRRITHELFPDELNVGEVKDQL